MSTENAENYFAAEPAIISRLATQIPELRKVGGWADYDTALESTPATPAVAVLYRGERAPDKGPAAALTEQRWIVALVMRVPSAQSAADRIREEAGQLVTKIIKSLHGFTPAPRHSAMEFAGVVGSEFYKGGTAIFALAFNVRRAAIVR